MFKMNTLGKYYHDFPRLAKESGYDFQLYRGKINWNDLDKVDIQEIVNNRNFHLLEEMLIQVINCNLEKEFDVSAFDNNLVKLFKLAQLGVDYLSYCELYLDRCVILLQEQLSTFQEQCLLLKVENEKKDEELKRNKQKIRLQSQNYKCNKCEKIFLTETYLKSHEKRRHRNSDESNDSRKFKNQTQQTEEDVKTVSTFTQTIADEISFPCCESDDKDFLKISEQELKIDNLKRDLEELKTRLSLAEKSMEEKRNDEKNFQSSFPNAVIPVIHSYISPQRSGYVQMPAPAAMVQSFPTQFELQENANEHQECVKKVNKPLVKELTRYSNSDRHLLNKDSFDEESVSVPSFNDNIAREVTLDKTSRNQEEISRNVYGNIQNNPPHSPPQRLEVLASTPKSETFMEETNPKDDIIKKTKNRKMNLEVEDIVIDSESSVWGASIFASTSDLTLESELTKENTHLRTSTLSKVLASPISKIRSSGLKNKWNNALSPTNAHKIKRKSKSEETLVQDISPTDSQEKSKSLLSKIVMKKSPKIQELKSNLKSSFSQLYESVSSTSKKDLGTKPGTAKAEIVEGLHNRLKELGIDPEWSGIPKETMKQKLKILEHHRSILTKENRLYPFLRRKLEKYVLKRIQGNSLLLKNQTAQMNDGSNAEKSRENNGANNVLTSEITVCDSEGDSELEFLELGQDKKTNSPCPSDSRNITAAESSKMANEKKEREATDFSIFQASKFKDGKPKFIELEVPDEIQNKQKFTDAQDELRTDSDFDDDLFKHFEEQSIQNITKHISDKTEISKNNVIGSFPEKADDNDEFSSSRMKIENQSILKSEAENNRLMTKKKVLFAKEPEIFETGTQHVTKSLVEKHKITNSLVDDDDDWSIESEWTINNEL